LDHLSRYFGCELALEQREVELHGIRFCCVPYRSLSSEVFKNPDYSSSLYNILVVHAAADGEGLPDWARYDHTRLDRTSLQNPAACLRLLGHIHIHKAISKNAYYSGAIERLTWGEISNTPSIYLHRINTVSGVIKTESHPIDKMGVQGVPRPALNLEIDCAKDSAQESVEAAHSILEENTLEDCLVQLHLKHVDRDIYSTHFEEALTTRATKRKAFALKTKIETRQAEELKKAQDNLSTLAEQIPGQALIDNYRNFATSTGNEDLADLGAELIAQTVPNAE
jgi:DNA repair exonuclease SbcCD nuclease subunit